MAFKNEETNIQVAVANYLRYKHPGILFTIAPSGIKLGIRTAKMLKAMGYRAGTPDLMIFEPLGGFHGLFMELKTEKGKLMPNQAGFIATLNHSGYKAVVCYGYNEAVACLDGYLQDK